MIFMDGAIVFADSNILILQILISAFAAIAIGSMVYVIKNTRSLIKSKKEKIWKNLNN